MFPFSAGFLVELLFLVGHHPCVCAGFLSDYASVIITRLRAILVFWHFEFVFDLWINETLLITIAENSCYNQKVPTVINFGLSLTLALFSERKCVCLAMLLHGKIDQSF